ncbi:hypothetical protein [Providencia vermicola]|uniref:hypothetical protein n=1 Tax=Providencia vermicola TaxID=333965 RepID=UPI0034E51CBA
MPVLKNEPQKSPQEIIEDKIVILREELSNIEKSYEWKFLNNPEKYPCTYQWKFYSSELNITATLKLNTKQDRDRILSNNFSGKIPGIPRVDFFNVEPFYKAVNQRAEIEARNHLLAFKARHQNTLNEIQSNINELNKLRIARSSVLVIPTPSVPTLSYRAGSNSQVTQAENSGLAKGIENTVGNIRDGLAETFDCSFGMSCSNDLDKAAKKTNVGNNSLSAAKTAVVEGVEKGYSECVKSSGCQNDIAKLGVNFGLTRDQIAEAINAGIAARKGDTDAIKGLSPLQIAYIDEQIISGKGMARGMFGTQTWGDRIDVKPHTGGNQIPEQGRIDTGGNQIPEQVKIDTGGNQIAEQGRTDTGGEQIPERIDNTHITPLPNQITIEDIAYLSKNKNKIKDEWHQGSFNSPEESLQKHYEKHGKDVGADSVAEYKRKAGGFAEDLKGARTAKIRGETDNVTRYYKNGKYLDKTTDGKIISFGKQ